MAYFFGRRGAARQLPPWRTALETFLARQHEPFTVSQLAAGMAAGPGALDPEVVPALQAHPAVAEHAGRFFTPRVLARCCRFVIRLAPEERSLGILIPGHRFYPFTTLSREPRDVNLRWPGGQRLPSDRVIVSADLAASTTRLMPRSFRVDAGYSSPTTGARVGCYRLPASLLRDRSFAGELVVVCRDYDQGTYEISQCGKGDASARAADERSLVAALVEIGQAPPPGPVEAPRQMLQVVARCLMDLSGEPIGPLGTVLTGAPGVELDTEDDAPAFVVVAQVEPIPYPAESSLGRLCSDLQESLQKTCGSWLRDLARRQGTVRHDALTEAFPLSFKGYVTLAREFGCGVQVTRAEEAGGTFTLACGQCSTAFHRGCRHAAFFLQDLLRVLCRPEDALTLNVRDLLAQPRWRHELLTLDRALAAAAPQADSLGAPPRPEKAQRLAWRIEARGGSLSLLPYLQVARKSGGWTRGRRVSIWDLLYANDKGYAASDVDVARATYPPSARYDYDYNYAPTLRPIAGILSLVGHPLVFWGAAAIEPVRVERGEAGVRAVRLPAGEICLQVAAGGVAAGADGIETFVADDGLVLYDARARRITVAPVRKDRRALVDALVAARTAVPPEGAAELAPRLAQLEALLPVELPPEIGGAEVPADARIHLLLTPLPAAGLGAAVRVRPVPGGATLCLPGLGPATLSGVAAERRVRARRDLEAEKRLAAEVARALGFALLPEKRPWEWELSDDESALDLVASLEANPRPDLVVEWPENKVQLLREAGPRDLRLRVEDRRDWFGIDGEIDVDGERVPLASILEALRSGRRYVAVAGRRWARISQLLRDRLRDLADVAHAERGGLEIGRAAAPFAHDLLAEAGTVEACKAWTEMRGRFDRAMQLAPDPPATLAAELRDYQVEGYRWLTRLAAWGVGGCLADDMGLGKTVQALAALLDRAAEGPALVVAPTSVGTNWIRETRRFCPTLNPILYRETDRLPDPDQWQPGDLVVTSYGLVLRDVEKLEQVRWATLVLDEAQFVKNSLSKTAAAVRRLRAAWRLALTGTPLENHLGDLWSLFRGVCPGLFGSWERFRERFAGPIERNKDAARRHALARLVRPFILRRAKSEVLDELPPRTEVQLTAELSPAERSLYDQTRLALLADLAAGGGKDGADPRFKVLAALTRLRQLACHPRLVFPQREIGSAKLAVFLETIEELRDEKHRALVFSQFTSYLALVRAALDEAGVTYQYLDGSTPARERDRAVDAFQRGEGDLFLISLKAGGTGLNLTAADYVIHLDPWWNPAVEDQATNRAHRIGQTRPVTVYRIVAAGTIEEQILALHADKRDLVAGVLEGTDQAAKLSTEDLIALIRGGAVGGAGVPGADARGRARKVLPAPGP